MAIHMSTAVLLAAAAVCTIAATPRVKEHAGAMITQATDLGQTQANAGTTMPVNNVNLEKTFDEVDTDNDGQITKVEFDASISGSSSGVANTTTTTTSNSTSLSDSSTYNGTSWGPECWLPDDTYVCDCPDAPDTNPPYYNYSAGWLCLVTKSGALKGFSLRKNTHVNLGGDTDDLTPFAETMQGTEPDDGSATDDGYRYVLDDGTSDVNYFDNTANRFNEKEMANMEGNGKVPPAIRVWAANTHQLTQGPITLEYRFIRAEICSFRWADGVSALIDNKIAGSTCASRKAIVSCTRTNTNTDCNALELASVAARA